MSLAVRGTTSRQLLIQFFKCLWFTVHVVSDVPVSNTSRLNFLNEDAELPTVLALQSHHAEAEAS